MEFKHFLSIKPSSAKWWPFDNVWNTPNKYLFDWQTVPLTCCVLTNTDHIDEDPIAKNVTACYDYAFQTKSDIGEQYVHYEVSENNDDVMTWTRFQNTDHLWGESIGHWLVSIAKGQYCGGLMFTLLLVATSCWINNWLWKFTSNTWRRVTCICINELCCHWWR